MKKLTIIVFIFSLIFSTALIKNSTKKIEDEIFAVNESLKNYENELSDTRLEFEYLSSTEKLLQYQTQFFEKDLNQKNINKIKIITKKLNNLSIDNSNIFKTNEKK
ncbi:cell division protein FtsL [Candidatus Pelagibacter sp.]|nr:cell division protein FtsL [Candidatus Pelagibacter sp.]